MQKVIIWSIAGSDCSGGAGIQADLKTGYALGAEVCTLITANTVQNSQQFIALNPVDVAVLEAQAQVLLSDKPPSVIKVGLLASEAQLIWLLKFIKQLRQTLPKLKVVLDPVLKATVMQTHFDFTTSTPFLSLLSGVNVITPNLDEAQHLLGVLPNPVSVKQDDFGDMAQHLSAYFKNTVVVKGGHSHSSTSVDMACDQRQVYQVTTAKINTTASHGGGCSFATALAVFIAQGFNFKDALVQAKAFMQAGFALAEGQTIGYTAFQQPHWPVAPQHYPKVVLNNLPCSDDMAASPVLDLPLGIYPVVDSLDWLVALKPFKFKLIQLRVKNLPQTELKTLIQKAVALFKDSSTQLMINDYWQLAIELGADGVHLGQEDAAHLTQTDWQTLKASGLALGLSSHGVFEFLWAEGFKPSYIAVGAIFETTTKDMSGQIQGIAGLKSVLARQSSYPIVAIGGLGTHNIAQIAALGVAGIGVVSAITNAQPNQTLAQRILSLTEVVEQY